VKDLRDPMNSRRLLARTGFVLSVFGAVTLGCNGPTTDPELQVAAASAPSPPAPTCTPKRCPDVRAECGPVPDGCGGTLDCGRCESPFQHCVSARCECGAVPGILASPHGSAGCPGRRVHSPDGKLYIEEVEPCHEGHFVARSTADDLLVARWDLNIPNDLKAVAWSDEGRRVALVYHWSHSSLLFVLEIGKAAPVAKAGGREHFHYARWNPLDDGSLFVAEACTGPLEKMTPTLL
jgi:hypothetical protein